MASPAIELSPGLIAVEKDGQQFTGIDTRIPTNSFSLRKLAGQKRMPGHLVREGSVSDWKAVSFTEYNGTVYLLGDPFKGRFVRDLLADPTADRLNALRLLAGAFSTFEKQGLKIHPIHTRSIVITDDGGVLFLPPDIMQAVREHQTYDERLESMELYNHPDRTPEDNVPFFLAAATYFVLTGRHPFEAEDEGDLHTRMRASTPIQARFRDVTLKPEISNTLQEALTTPAADNAATLWGPLLGEWIRAGFSNNLSDTERETLTQEAQTAVEKIDRTYRRRETVRKNWRKTSVIAIIALVIGSIPGTIIYNALQPRVTAGFTPEAVVETFYTSINTLDHMTMEDCVIDRAGQAFILEVTNLFVIDRQRMSVEMQSGFVDAQLWRDDGMPALTAGRQPYGVAYLVFEESVVTETEVRITVSYERWRPDYPEEGENVSSYGYAGNSVREVLSLRKDKDDWVIYQIDGIESERLDVTELRESANS